VPGSRWISATESDLGLGTVLRVASRRAEVHFGAVGETRVYAIDTAPLTRVRFEVGDQITDADNQRLEVVNVEEDEGVLVYIASDGENVRAIVETSLSDLIEFTDAKSRLFSGQTDSTRWFDLRVRTHNQRARAVARETFGLSGARISPVPHQLYIADEVSRRYAPRVLLADEVGLGKTIEACLILHRQILQGRVSRALVLVPEPLINQWLVELKRRFNLTFSIFDDDRIEALVLEDPDMNPFESEQLIIASADFLVLNSEALDSAMQVSWDMLIVDEAHHLQWEPGQVSPQYSVVEQLSGISPGVLLLTATPEQLGEQGHFARLRLLDPDRFQDLDTWLTEQDRYQKISAIAESLATDESLDKATVDDLSALLGDDAVARAQTPGARAELIRELIDRHGTSRVMFRNTRSAIPGFPSRMVVPHSLEYESTPPPIASDLAISKLPFPENVWEHLWPEQDPRVSWLINLLAELKTEKVLVICASVDTAIELEEAMRVRAGVRAGLFHEDLSLINRDRAAAWFADTEDGAQVLVSSEIGSEGRNFQFASHLVLFDLPLNPDLLEQRIGRLDRIGQEQDIKLHVPYILGTPGEVLYRWYHEGLNALERSIAVGNTVLDDLRDELESCLRDPAGSDVEALIDKARTQTAMRIEAVETGRDRLLEIASFDRSRGEKLATSMTDSDEDPELADYMEQVFDMYGVESEDDTDTLILHQGARMEVDDFPGIPEEGITGTWQRSLALAKEDHAFLSGEHPIAFEAMDLVLRGDRGRTSMVALPVNVLPSGTVLVEALFVLEVVAPGFAAFRRFMPELSVRNLIESGGRDLTALIGSRVWPERFQDLDLRSVKMILSQRRDVLRQLIDLSTSLAAKKLEGVREQGLANIEAFFNAEITRLEHLKEHNPNVRADEISTLKSNAEVIVSRIKSAPVRLDGIRVHVVP